MICRLVVLALVIGFVAPAARAQAAPDAATLSRLQELETQVRHLTEQIERLRAQAMAAPAPATAAGADARTAELERKVEVLTEEMTSRRSGLSFDQPLESRWGLGPAASKVYGADRGVSLGGYGEILWQGFDATRDDGARSGKKDEIDALRAILYFGYRFSDRIVFNSEIEFEHANTGADGEVEVEFANVDFLLHDAFNVRAGLMLVPMGILNELHEPTTFWSARRPVVESVIIPTTWAENGFGFFGDKGPVSYRAYVVAGLDASGFSAASGLRGGRQKGSKSTAEDLAFVGRVDFDPVPGLMFGLSGFFGNSAQDATLAGKELDVAISLWDIHASYEWRGFGLRALYAQGSVGDVTELNALLGLAGTKSIGSRIEGWYGEAGYDVLASLDTKQELIPFVRYEDFDTQARVPAGFARDPANARSIWTYGFAYKPHPQVVIKLDYQDVDNEAGTGVDQVNAAVGYSF